MSSENGGFFFLKIKNGLDKANAEMNGLSELRATVHEANEDLKRATDDQVIVSLSQNHIPDEVGSVFYGDISIRKNKAGSRTHKIIKIASIENQLFPLKIVAIGSSDNWVCSNIDEFKSSLADIFSIPMVALRILHLKNIEEDPDDSIPF